MGAFSALTVNPIKNILAIGDDPLEKDKYLSYDIDVERAGNDKIVGIISFHLVESVDFNACFLGSGIPVKK